MDVVMAKIVEIEVICLDYLQNMTKILPLLPFFFAPIV